MKGDEGSSLQGPPAPSVPSPASHTAHSQPQHLRDSAPVVVFTEECKVKPLRSLSSGSIVLGEDGQPATADALLQASIRANVLDPLPNMPAILSWMQSIAQSGNLTTSSGLSSPRGPALHTPYSRSSLICSSTGQDQVQHIYRNRHTGVAAGSGEDSTSEGDSSGASQCDSGTTGTISSDSRPSDNITLVQGEEAERGKRPGPPSTLLSGEGDGSPTSTLEGWTVKKLRSS